MGAWGMIVNRTCCDFEGFLPSLDHWVLEYDILELLACNKAVFACVSTLFG